MDKENVNINPIDFKELKKNLFPLMKLLKKINDGKKKGLNSNDNVENIKNKIEFISNNSDILLNKKFKFLYASLCLLQIQNNSYLNEIKNLNKKKRTRKEIDKEVSKETELRNKKARTDLNDTNENQITKKKDNEKIEKIDDNESNSDLKKEEMTDDKILENIKLRNSKKKKNKKKNANPEIENIKHLIDVMEFVKYCKQKPFSDEALFPVLPLKTSKEDGLSLFSRLENITDEKMEDIINTYAGDHKDFYNRCWEDLQKKEENEEDDDDEIKSTDYKIEEKSEPVKEESNKKIKKKNKGKEISNELNILSSDDEEEDLQDIYTDYIPNQVYRSRIWTDGIMDRFKHLLEEKKEEKVLNQKRIKVCTECLSKFRNRLQYIPCSGDIPCERCKRLGLICYYPFLKKQGNVKRYGSIYRLKENVNNPLTHQEYDERYETEEQDTLMRNLHDHIEYRNIAFKKLINDAHIVGDNEDYLQYRQNTKINYWIKNTHYDKNNVYLRPYIQAHKKQLEREKKKMEDKGEKPFLGKTNPKIPTSELLDSIQYCVSKRVSLEKQNENMVFKYDSSALITLGILFEELIKHEVENFNKPEYYQ